MKHFMNYLTIAMTRYTSVLILFIASMSASISASAQTVYPESLKPGDKIAVLSPAGPIKSAPVDTAVQVLKNLGYEPVIYPHAFGEFGHFSGTHDERFEDMKAAFMDTTIRAILCTRGGYGVVHNLDRLGKLPIENDPKWVIGFSDISALHALMASKNIASIHASMARQIALGPEDPDNAVLFDILTGGMPEYDFEPDSLNHLGHAEGKLLGGNLAVIADLIATPYDVIQPETVLFIEDVSEPIYKTERIIYQLRLMGILDKLKGLIIGQFTDNKPDDNHESTEVMLGEALADYPDLPVAFNVPMGHVDHNVPFVESAYVTLDVTEDGVKLKFERK